jgi:hypothetical protein
VDPKQLTAGQDLKVTLAHGTVGLRVERVLPPSKNRAWGPVS